MEVWDLIRRKWLVLTPEEHVRQCLVHYLLDCLKVPKGLMSLERVVKYNSMSKRYDVLVFDRQGAPFLLCECKAPYVPINDETLFQWSVYHRELQSQVLLLTNGKVLLAAARDGSGEWRPLKLPLSPGAEGWTMGSREYVFED
jgi:hypothetical protein